MKRVVHFLAGVVALAMVGVTFSAASASASTGPTNTDTVTHSTLVSDVPMAATPNIDDGTVLAFAQIGNTTIVGGTFTGFTDVASGTHYAQKKILAFNSTTGAVISTFAPKLDGNVNSLVPGPVANSVIVGGEFNVVSTVQSKSLVMLDVTTGAVNKTFKPPTIDGKVNVIKRAGTRLFVGGSFTTLGGIAHGGIGTVDATTGALDPFVSSNVATHHNWVPGSTGSMADVGVSDLAITPDGTHMVVIGNFKTVDGISRDQVVVFDLTGTQAVVQANWHTQQFQAACAANGFDATVRAVDISPDGKYFVVASTGGSTTASCDAAARFEFSSIGDSILPTWNASTGRDSLFSVAITGAAVYIGGHERWMNNPNGADNAGGGAVPRPGMAALDPNTGIPLAWNAARNPRGAGAYSLFATPTGLYVGMDTDYIGSFHYLRMKMAFFPLAGGAPVASDTTQALPGNIYLGTVTPGTTNVLYRVNAGGPAVPSLDSGPAWSDDSGTSSSFRNSGSSTSSYNPVANVDSTVPASTPRAIFDTERYDPQHNNQNQNLLWSFPVASGTQVDVRLFFANRCTCTSTVGSRVFNVTVNGSTVLSNFDVVATAGDQTGTMKDFVVTAPSTGRVTIGFGRITQNPNIDGIEILKTGVIATPPTDTWNIRSYNGTTVGGATASTTPLSVSNTRAATMIGGKLYYAGADGNFYSRTFDGGVFGPQVAIDPYNDPFWSTIDNGSGGTYRGMRPSFYGQLPTLSSMFYDPTTKRLYYTLTTSTGLFYRTFSSDSSIMYPNATQVSGVSLPSLSGAFLTGGNLYYVTKTDGILHRVAFNSTTGAPSGTAANISGPLIDGVSWTNQTFFLAPTVPVHQAPTASFTSNCTGLTCTFDATASQAHGGTLTAYAWDFGDGTTGTGVTASHVYNASGPQTVTLTVTDDSNASGVTSQGLNPTRRPATAAATGSCVALTCSFDATGSSSPDGSITSYAWDFGDGTTDTGATPTHTYANPGPVTATVTVTDDALSTASTTVAVSPTVVAPSNIAFRAEAGVSQNQVAPNLTIPASVQNGDQLLLFASSASVTSQTAPAGWALLGTQTSQTLMTTVWQKTATATDAGSKVTVTLNVAGKTDLHVMAYSGADVASVIGLAQDGSNNSHTAPSATVGTGGSWVVRYWADKTSTTTAWTAPSGVTTRDSLVGTGSGRVSTLLADSGVGVPAGASGTATATTNATSGRAVSATIVLPSLSGRRPPVAIASGSCVDQTCSFDGSTSNSPDGSIVSYAWDFGDGMFGTGATPTHAYATPGPVTVTLTVTDDASATAITTVGVNPTAPAVSHVAFRAVAGVLQNQVNTNLSVPNTVQPGDVMLLFASTNNAVSQATPAGWTLLGTQTSQTLMTSIWEKVAVLGDAGSKVTVVLDAANKTDLHLLAYSGATAPSVIGLAQDGSSNTHIAPAATVAVGTSWVVRYWADKTSTTTTWTAPVGVVQRDSLVGTGSGRVDTLLADSGAPVPAGSSGTATATTDATSGRGVSATIVIPST
jgi:PKD repeat protein